MSFAELHKVTIVGLSSEKLDVLESLQTLGSLHIIQLENRAANADLPSSNGRGREALQFLLSSHQKFRQVSNDQSFKPERVEAEAIRLRERLDALILERDRLATLIEERRPWGNFKPPDGGAMNNQRLWLYRIPTYQQHELQKQAVPWEIVARDNKFVYAVIISERQLPSDSLPVPPLSPDSRSLVEMEMRLEELELAVDDVQVERNSLSRWCLLLSRNLDRLDDKAALRSAQGQTHDTDRLFALQAWVPVARLPELEAFAQSRAVILDASPPEPGELPPTKFENPEPIAGGEELVSFYMTPSYRLCDPSSAVFFGFGIFFAMIMADAGYGLLLAITTAALWKRLGGSQVARRWRLLLVWITGLTIVYGVLVGSYFGVEPKSQMLKSLHLVDMRNYSQMMILSAVIGAVHLTIANAMNAWRYRGSTKLLVPLGWALMIDGGMTLALSSSTESSVGKAIGAGALACGALLVFLFTAAEEKFGKRVMFGLLGLTKVTSAFGDVLSYLRLFALGLASASLAAVFNSMANSLYHKIAGLGLLLAILVLIFGHAVNLFLSISSGFIHGLRLNVIEFFNWGVQEEGKIFRPFSRKETVNWKR